MKYLTIIFSFLLVGCGSLQPILNGAATTAITNIKTAEDSNIALWKVNVCGTPYSAIIRHPEIVPAIRALCLPSGNSANPAALLDGVQP